MTYFVVNRNVENNQRCSYIIFEGTGLVVYRKKCEEAYGEIAYDA
jgi:hypothetical protein